MPARDRGAAVACCSSPAGSPSRRCGACSPRWRRRSPTTSPSSKITVAALMTTDWIARASRACPAADRPRADSGPVRRRSQASIADRLGVPVEKGPKDLREIPQHFGRAAAARRLRRVGHRDPRRDQQRPAADAATPCARAADYFRASGADVIDIGCTPGLPFPALGDVVRELVAAGMRVSIDTFDAGEIRDRRRRRRRAGAQRQRLEHRRRARSRRNRRARRGRAGSRRLARHARAEPRTSWRGGASPT